MANLGEINAPKATRTAGKTRVKKARVYKNPMNDPNSPKYWKNRPNYQANQLPMQTPVKAPGSMVSGPSNLMSGPYAGDWNWKKQTNPNLIQGGQIGGYSDNQIPGTGGVLSPIYNQVNQGTYLPVTTPTPTNIAQAQAYYGNQLMNSQNSPYQSALTSYPVGGSNIGRGGSPLPSGAAYKNGTNQMPHNPYMGVPNPNQKKNPFGGGYGFGL